MDIPMRPLLKIYGISLLLLLMAAVSCAPVQQEPTSPSEPPVTISSLLVLPVDPIISVRETPDKDKMQALQQGATVMDELLAAYLQKKQVPGLTLLSENQFESRIGSRTGSRLALGLVVAKEMGQDAVLSMRLSRFSERQGNKYSVDAPASLAFEFKAVRTSTGEVLCSGSFDQSQQTLFENLFSFSKKSLHWLTIREFAEIAIKKKLDACSAFFAPHS